MKSEKIANAIVADDGDRLMSLTEAAARLQTSLNGLRELLKRTDKLRTIKKGKYLYIRKYALNSFVVWLEKCNVDMMELVHIEREAAQDA